MVLKTPVGTASRGNWIVKDDAQLADKRSQRSRPINGFDESLVVAGRRRRRNPAVSGGVRQRPPDRLACLSSGRARGRWRQRDQGERQPSDRAAGISHESANTCIGMARLSVDYIVDQASGTPYYFDCNPRLVEPMSAVFAGLDLVELLLQVSCGETPWPPCRTARAASAPILLCRPCLGCAAREESRVSVLRECWRLSRQAGPLCREQGGTDAGGDRLDELSCRRRSPRFGCWRRRPPRITFRAKGWGAQLLTPQSIRTIKTMDVGG